jgi:hypothetical protein
VLASSVIDGAEAAEPTAESGIEVLSASSH